MADTTTVGPSAEDAVPDPVPIALAEGLYYWDGRALWPGGRREGAGEGAGPGFSIPVWAALQTLAICGGISGLLVVLTSSWEQHRTLVGISHAIALLPILLIDPVYRWLLRNGPRVSAFQHLVSNWWRGPQRTSGQVPWWMCAGLCASAIAVLSEALFESPLETGLWGDLIVFGSVGALFGFLIRRGSKRRSVLTMLVAIAAGLVAWWLVLDPTVARTTHQAGLQVQGLGDLIAAFVLFYPVYVIGGSAGFLLARLSLRLWPWSGGSR